MDWFFARRSHRAGFRRCLQHKPRRPFRERFYPGLLFALTIHILRHRNALIVCTKYIHTYQHAHTQTRLFSYPAFTVSFCFSAISFVVLLSFCCRTDAEPALLFLSEHFFFPDRHFYQTNPRVYAATRGAKTIIVWKMFQPTSWLASSLLIFSRYSNHIHPHGYKRATLFVRFFSYFNVIREVSCVWKIS